MGAPVPRLQLRWVRGDGHEEYFCHYELVLPLHKYDIRRDVYKDDEVVTKVNELLVPIGGSTRVRTGQVPCRMPNGTAFPQRPFRDGVHASRDSAALNNLPIFVIDLDGAVMESKDEPHATL